MSCNHSLEKAQSSQHAVLGTRTSTCGSLQQEPYHIQYKKINLQVIRALDLLFDSIKLLEENNAKKICKIPEWVNISWNLEKTPEPWTVKAKIEK